MRSSRRRGPGRRDSTTNKVVEYARTPVNQYTVPGPAYTMPTATYAMPMSYGTYGTVGYPNYYSTPATTEQDK